MSSRFISWLDAKKESTSKDNVSILLLLLETDQVKRVIDVPALSAGFEVSNETPEREL